jgi:hypothetical protein
MSATVIFEPGRPTCVCLCRPPFFYFGDLFEALLISPSVGFTPWSALVRHELPPAITTAAHVSHLNPGSLSGGRTTEERWKQRAAPGLSQSPELGRRAFTVWFGKVVKTGAIRRLRVPHLPHGAASRALVELRAGLPLESAVGASRRLYNPREPHDWERMPV